MQEKTCIQTNLLFICFFVNLIENQSKENKNIQNFALKRKRQFIVSALLVNIIVKTKKQSKNKPHTTKASHIQSVKQMESNCATTSKKQIIKSNWKTLGDHTKK